MTAVYPEVDVEPPSFGGLSTLGAFASTQATDAPPSLEPDERERLRTAARKAESLFPGPVGKYLRTDLESWASYGCYRFDGKGAIRQCVDAILAMPLPEPPAAAAAA